MIRTWRASVAAQAVQLSRLTPVDDDDAADAVSSSAAFAERAGAQAQVGRLLRLPTREV